MPLEEKLYTALTGSATLTAIVGTAIYPVKRAQGGTLPAVSYRRASGSREHSTLGYVTVENAHIELNVYATAVTARRKTGDAAVGAISSSITFKGLVISSPQDFYNDETAEYVRRFDISIWNQE
jgi:hypothetical protein